MAFESTLYDPRGNEFVGNLDSIIGQGFTDARSATVNLGALNAEGILYLNGHSTVLLDIRGTWVGTITFQGTIDGSNWITLPAIAETIGGYIQQTTANTTALIDCPGYKAVKAIMTAYTSGTAVVAGRASQAKHTQISEPLAADQCVTATGAAAAAVTLTLGAPVAGMKHYIVSLTIQAFATALRVAAATPVIVTTTNLPGSLAFSFSAAASAQGTMDTQQFTFGANPLESSVAATATTIVCPATTSVIWRVTAMYLIAP